MLAETELRPDRETNAWLASAGIELTAQTTFAKLTQRPNADLERIAEAAAQALPEVAAVFRVLTDEETEGVASQLRYAGYIERQRREAGKMQEDEDLAIPRSMSYTLPGLSREMIQRFSEARPETLGQAQRIPGVTPAAVAVVGAYLDRF